ncbi:MAG TPA: universal stress protein, partial [Chroococcales cyanobacterium]
MKIVVAFSSPKRSAKTVEAAARQAKATNAELVLLRIVPDPEKVGVVAQLISTDRPMDTAQNQIDETVARLKEQGINASGLVKRGEVARGIMKTAEELKADLVFVGTTNIEKRPAFLMKKDPIVHYLVDHCPISLCLVRRDFPPEEP